jgi:hypothetical protein
MAQGFLIGETLLGQIKDTVKRVQGEPMVGNISRIETRFEGGPATPASKTFRICTFTGAWAINGEKTVTFRGVTTTPNTVSATNLLLDVPNAGATATRNCAIAKDGTAWYLVFPQVKTRNVTLATGTASQSVVTDVSVSGSLNTTNCSITINRTLTTAQVSVQTGTFTATIITLESL